MEDALAPRLAALRKGTDLAPELIDRFGRWARQSDDADLYRFNPLDWARKLEIPEETAIDRLLHGLAADFGLRAREDRVQLRGIADDVLVHRLS